MTPTPPPTICTTLPPPDAYGRCRLRDKSEVSYQLTRPVVCSGIYSSIAAEEGCQADVQFRMDILGFLAAYVPYEPRPGQWLPDGGVRLVKDPAIAGGDGNALCLRDVDGRFILPGARPNYLTPGTAPKHWSGLESLAYAFDWALVVWAAPDAFPIDLACTYEGDGGTPGPFMLRAYPASFALGLTDAAGYRESRIPIPGGTPAPGSRHAVKVELSNCNAAAGPVGTWTVRFDGAAIGTGSFAAPIAEVVDGSFCIGAQRAPMYHAPDMVFYSAAVTADGVTETLTPPPAPDFWWGKCWLLDDPATQLGRDWAAGSPTDFARVRIQHASTALAVGGNLRRITIRDCDFEAESVGLHLGLDGGSCYPVTLERVTIRSAGFALIRAAATIATIRDALLMYPFRHAVLARDSNLCLDSPLVCGNAAPLPALFKVRATQGGACLLAVRFGCFDYESTDPGPEVFVDADATPIAVGGGMPVIFDQCGFGNGKALAKLGSGAATPAGAGALVVRDCFAWGAPPPFEPDPGWTTSVDFHRPPTPGRVGGPRPPAPE
jgi:hypothetical protein